MQVRYSFHKKYVPRYISIYILTEVEKFTRFLYYLLYSFSKLVRLATKILPNFDVSHIGDNFGWPVASLT